MTVNRLCERVDVPDWDALADALAAKDHSRGAVFHLPELGE